MNTRTIASAALAATLLTTAACSTPGKVADKTPTGVNAPSAVVSTYDPGINTPPTQPTEPEPTATSTDPATIAFGKTFEWENHLSVTVSAPKPFTPSDTAFGGEAFKSAVQFTIVLVNKSGKPFDASMVYTSVQSNDVEADEIYDSAKGFNGAPETKVLNNRQAKFRVAFGVANPKDIVFELTPGGENVSTLWTM
jgi:hypothetical protein